MKNLYVRDAWGNRIFLKYGIAENGIGVQIFDNVSYNGKYDPYLIINNFSDCYTKRGTKITYMFICNKYFLHPDSMMSFGSVSDVINSAIKYAFRKNNLHMIIRIVSSKKEREFNSELEAVDFLEEWTLYLYTVIVEDDTFYCIGNGVKYPVAIIIK